MLSVNNLYLYYGGIRALKGVSLEVKTGEIVTLLGNNGAGKTSTLNTISGVLKQKKGEINFDGQDISAKPPHKIARAGVIQVPEGRQLFLDMTVDENIEIGATAVKGKLDLKEELKKIWEMFPVLEERRSQLAGKLSGGEQQMVAIARSLVAKPKLLLLDEPSLGLSPIMTELIFKTIRDLREYGQTILLVEQNAWMSLKIADRGYIISNGAIVLEGKSKELLDNEMVKDIYLGGH